MDLDVWIPSQTLTFYNWFCADIQKYKRYIKIFYFFYSLNLNFHTLMILL